MSDVLAAPGVMGHLAEPYYGDPVKMQIAQSHQDTAITISLGFAFIIFILLVIITIVYAMFKIWEIKYSFRNRLELVRSVTDPDYNEDRSKTFVRMAGLYEPFIGALTSSMSEQEAKKQTREAGNAVKNNTVPYEEALEVAKRQGQLNLIHQLFDNNVTDKEIYRVIGHKVSITQIAALREHYEE